MTDSPCEPTLRPKAHWAVPGTGPVLGRAYSAVVPKSGATSAFVSNVQGAGSGLVETADGDVEDDDRLVIPVVAVDAAVDVVEPGADELVLDEPHAARPASANI